MATVGKLKPAPRTREERKAHNMGGWGETKDAQVCEHCGKTICGADLSKKAVSESSTKCQGQGRCHNPAGSRTPHRGIGPCSLHLGNTPTIVQATARQEVRVMMRRYGAPVDGIDAEDALREEIARTVGHVRWLAETVAEIGDDEGETVPDQPNGARIIEVTTDEDDDEERTVTRQLSIGQTTGDKAMVWGVIERETQVGGAEGGFDRVKQGAGVNTWLQVYQAERGHLAKICDIAMRANLEGRRMDWAEAMADRLIESFEAMAEALGQDPNDPAVQAAITANMANLVGVTAA